MKLCLLFNYINDTIHRMILYIDYILGLNAQKFEQMSHIPIIGYTFDCDSEVMACIGNANATL